MVGLDGWWWSGGAGLPLFAIGGPDLACQAAMLRGLFQVTEPMAVQPRRYAMGALKVGVDGDGDIQGLGGTQELLLADQCQAEQVVCQRVMVEQPDGL